MKFVDIHSHHKNSDPDVVQIVSVGDKTDWANEIVDKSTLFSVGFHPWYINDTLDILKMMEQLETAANQNNVVAIGECGYDKLRGPSIKTQEEWLKKQIDLSEKLDKPLIIHCVKYLNEIISLRKKLKPQQNWILHGYNGNPELTKQAENAGFFFSFNQSNGLKFENLIRTIPKNRLFLETDNGLDSIKTNYQKAAEILEIGLDDIKQIIWNNYTNTIKNN